VNDQTTTLDLSTWTPVQVDTEIARIYDLQYDNAFAQQRAVDSLEHRLHEALGRGWKEKRQAYSREFLDQVCTTEGLMEYTRQGLRDADQRLLDLKMKAQDLRDEMAPYDAEYRSRRWNRAFLAVTNGSGHVHSSMACSTCNKMGHSTRFSWMVDWSGADEATIVADAGERACTVCYPSAPVEVLASTTKMFSAEEKTKQERAIEREAKRQEKAAATVTLDVWVQRYSETQPSLRNVTWKTTRALQNDAGALVRQITGAYAMINGFDLTLRRYTEQGQFPVNTDEAFHNLRLMLEALKERDVDTEALVAKNHKRVAPSGTACSEPDHQETRSPEGWLRVFWRPQASCVGCGHGEG
jgi:hypothetical protein